MLNLLPRAKSNFSIARSSDTLPSLTSSKKFWSGVTCRLAIDTTSRRFARAIWFLRRDDLLVQLLDLVHHLGLGLLDVELLAELRGLVLQVVVLAEQVLLLLAGEQRHLVQAGQVRRQARRTPRLAGRGVALGHRAEDGVVGALAANRGLSM